MADRDDLRYTADRLRDLRSGSGRDYDEQHVQATMQEETAVAMHRVAEAIEDLVDLLEHQESR